MRKAWIVYGPPGSGKSTEARALAQGMKSVRHLERDIIRFDVLKLGNWNEYRFDPKKEYIVDAIWKYIVLNNDYNDLIISDTLCKKSDRDNLVALLQWIGYDVELIRMNTSLEECIERDKIREGYSVGEEVIKRMWRKCHEDN